MTGVTGRTERVERSFVDIEIGGLKIPVIKAVASQFSTEVSLGQDLLNHLGVTLNGIERRTEIS